MNDLLPFAVLLEMRRNEMYVLAEQFLFIAQSVDFSHSHTIICEFYFMCSSMSKDLKLKRAILALIYIEPLNQGEKFASALLERALERIFFVG